MPYKYIGRTTDFRGKTLWEIVGNLKNFGIGRIVVRSRFERYPEPSYMKILKVEPLSQPLEPSMDNPRRVKAWVERTFRGKTSPDPVLIQIASYKADYRLIPKDEESKYCKKVDTSEAKIYPRNMEFPPLLKELIIREAKAKGEGVVEEPKMDIVYNVTITRKHRIAKEGETPSLEIPIRLGKVASPSLYENIKMSK